MYQSLHTTVVGPGRRSARGSDPHASRCTARASTASPRTGATKKAARRDELREQAHLAALAARVAERHARFARVHGEPQARPVREPGLRLLAQGRRVLAARRRDAARFRLSGAHRRRQPLRRREGQRQDRPARLPAARTATSARFSSTRVQRARRSTGSRSSRPRAPSTRSSSGSARSARKRTSLAGPGVARARAGAPTPARRRRRAASCSKRSRKQA